MKLMSDRTVYEELYSRLIGIFSHNLKVYFSFSGGKDSLCVAQALVELIEEQKIDPALLVVIFIDEEGIYPCTEKIVLHWRLKFLLLGAQFLWLCIPFRHFNCFNMLTKDESFILFEPGKEDVWIRKPPAFAIRSHPAFKPGMSYQEFMVKIVDGLQIIGVRASESVQRHTTMRKSGGKTKNRYFPIYDWSLNDVWLYLWQKGVEVPDAYMFMWKIGVPITQLRISQFFSIDSCASLVNMMQFYPNLFQKVIKREPNAYLAMYYWDSEMFRRSSAKRRALEDQSVNWRSRFFEKYNNFPDKNNPMIKTVKTLLVKFGCYMDERLYKMLADCLEAGDPKNRTIRAIYSIIGQNMKKV
jgi:predicted phosphoadenosine phosphosulfate sulfurtransferase